MTKRPESSRPRTRERVRRAAFRLFGRFGYDGVSMLTVARDSGVTKAALYWHYDSKETLYADCMQHLVDVFEHHVFTRAQQRDEPIERVFALFEGLDALLAEPELQEGIAGYWLVPSTADVAQARSVQSQFETVSETLIEDTLKQARNSKALALDVSPQDMARAFIAIMEAIVLPLRNRTPRQNRHLVGVLAHIFFKAHGDSPGWAERALALTEPHTAKDVSDPRIEKARLTQAQEDLS